MIARVILRRGSEAAIAPPQSLRAGPLTMFYEAGELRDLRLGGVEVVRRI